MSMYIGNTKINSVSLINNNSENNSSIITCNNIEELKSLNIAQENKFIKVLGYYSVDDGGSSDYLIKDSQNYTSDELLDITLNNGFIAKRILNNNEINVLSLGIKKDNSSSDVILNNSNILKSLFEKYNDLYIAYFPSGVYYINNVNLDDNKHPNGRRISLKGEHTSESNSAWNVEIWTRGENFLTTNNSEQDFITVKNISFQGNKPLDGDTTLRTTKCFSSEFANEFNFNFVGVKITRFGYGWYCTNFACGGSYAKDLTLIANYYGIYIPKATHGFKIEGLHCHYNRFAVYLPTGGTENKITGFNYSPGYLSNDKDDFEEYIGIYTCGNGLTIDGMYLEDYLGTQVSPEKSIAIDYKCSSSSKLYINRGIFLNYAGVEGEKVIRYKGEYGKNNLIITNSDFNKDSLAMIDYDTSKVLTGITIDGRNTSIYGKKMYINEFPQEKRFIAPNIMSASSLNLTSNGTTYSVFEIPFFYRDLRNKSMIIGSENINDDGKYLPTIGNWLDQAPSYYEIKGHFEINNYPNDGSMKLFVKTSSKSGMPKVIDFEVINGKSYIPIDICIDFYNTEETSSSNFIIAFFMGTKIGDSNSLGYYDFISGTSYDLEFTTPDNKFNL